jgi:hypothetical protein
MMACPCRKTIKNFRKMAFPKATLMGYIVVMGMFAKQWMKTECNDCNGADFILDGNVDYNDLDVFVDNWL